MTKLEPELRVLIIKSLATFEEIQSFLSNAN